MQAHAYPDDEDEFPRLSTSYVARRLAVSTRHVRYLAAAGEIRATKVGKLWRFSRRDLLRYLRRRRNRDD